MMSINLAAFLTSAFFIYNIFKITGINDKLAAAGMLLFGFWPLVGLTYTVDPLADIPATFLFLMGFYFLLASRRLPAALLLGLSMVTHKAMWPFTGLLLIADFIYRREFISKRNIAFLIVMLLPTGVLWLLGSFYHHSVTWLFSGNLGVEISPRSDLLILDGLLGTFIGGGIKGLSKGIILIGFACVSVFTIYASLKLKYENYHYGLAVSFAVLFLFLILNQNEIWAAMRFGRLMVIPLTFIASTHGGFREKFRWNSPASIATWSILLLSQFAYAWYMATVFFG